MSLLFIEVRVRAVDDVRLVDALTPAAPPTPWRIEFVELVEVSFMEFLRTSFFRGSPFLEFLLGQLEELRFSRRYISFL